MSEQKCSNCIRTCKSETRVRPICSEYVPDAQKEKIDQLTAELERFKHMAEQNSTEMCEWMEKANELTAERNELNERLNVITEKCGQAAFRGDALAATIMALRDVVTHDAETKAEFVSRVREVLSADPDERLTQCKSATRPIHV